MHSDFITKAYTEGIRLAIEQPDKIKFISFSMALFFDDKNGKELRVFKLTKTDNEEWVCDCPHFRTMQKHWHPNPICPHSIAASRILRGDHENIIWLHQSSKNSLVNLQEQPFSRSKLNSITCPLGKPTFLYRSIARQHRSVRQIA